MLSLGYGVNKEHAICLETSLNITHSEAEALWCGQWDFIRILRIFKRGSVKAVRHRDEGLEGIVRFYAAEISPTFVLMDDNARPHRAATI